MRFVSIDVETTGLDPKRCQIVELAMIDCELLVSEGIKPIPGALPHPKGSAYVNRMDSLHLFVQPRKGDRYEGDDYAINLHKQMIERIMDGREDSVAHHELSGRIFDFLHRNGYHRGASTKLLAVPCGKNVGRFDMAFMAEHVDVLCPEELFHNRAIDVGILWLRPDDDVPPDLAECKRRAGITDNREPHRALNDAFINIELVQAWMRQWLADEDAHRYARA